MTISNILGCTGLVFLFLLIPFFWPLLPVPFLFYSSKLGLNEGIKVSLAALLAVGIVGRLLGESYLVLFCLQLGIVGLILSELFRREYSYSLTVFWGTLFMVFAGLAFMLFVSISEGLSLGEMVDKSLQANIDAVIGMYENGDLKPEQIAQLKRIGAMLAGLFKKIYPSVAVVSAGFIVWLNVVISKPLFRIKGIKYPDLGRSDMWRAPEFLVWMLIAAGFSKLLSVSFLDFAATNVLIIVSTIYVFHGLSIVLFFFNKYNVPALTRYVTYLIIVLQQLSMIILALLGLFDQWIDFRKIHVKARDTE